MRDTRPATDTLKGLAIAVVMVNHYLMGHVTDTVGGIAYTFLAIFFLASGYGIRFSLARREVRSLGGLARFWAQRLLRIVPLHFAAVLLREASLGRPLQLLDALNVYGPRAFWFVPAICNCYLLAPLLFAALRRWGAARVLACGVAVVALGTVAVHAAAPAAVVGAMEGLELLWKRAFGLHFLLFVLGMAAAGEEGLSRLESERQSVGDQEPGPAAGAVWLGLFAAFPVVYWLSKNVFHGALSLGLQLAAVLLAVALFGYGTSRGVAFRPLAWLGRSSYGLYLLHMTYLNALGSLGLLEGSGGALWAIGLSPLLLAVARLAEGAAARFARAAGAWLDAGGRAA
jgi:peptidoglycan/LPS O-acetylase OafA/YrhL